MVDNYTSRRSLLKKAGLGASLSAAGKLSVAGAASARPGKGPKQFMSVDVLVVGGGPAGIGAALGAARNGADTLLIERHGFFGGVAAWSLGMNINQMRPGADPRSVIHELVIERLVAYGDQAVQIGQHQLDCNVDYLKVAVLDALEEVGCKYLVHLAAADALMDGNRVTGVVVPTKQGLMRIAARAVVDCTGDADVACFAGAETMMETETRRMPSALLLNLANVSDEDVKRASIREIMAKARSKYPLIPTDRWRLRRVSGCHHYYINHHGTKHLAEYDVTDPFERSEAECASRRQVVQMTKAMREFSGGDLAEIELVGAGAQIAIRESRRVKGSYVLTEGDSVNGRKFDDRIAWRSGYLDQAGVRPQDVLMKIHDVPYRCILPVKVDGLLTAGRCISTSHVATAAGKSMGNCVATGHAAGLAAALSARKKIVPRELGITDLQDALRNDGVDLDKGGTEQVDVSTSREV